MIVVCVIPLIYLLKIIHFRDQWEFQDPKIALKHLPSYGVYVLFVYFFGVSEMAIEQIQYSLDL